MKFLRIKFLENLLGLDVVVDDDDRKIRLLQIVEDFRSCKASQCYLPNCQEFPVYHSLRTHSEANIAIIIIHSFSIAMIIE